MRWPLVGFFCPIEFYVLFSNLTATYHFSPQTGRKVLVIVISTTQQTNKLSLLFSLSFKENQVERRALIVFSSKTFTSSHLRTLYNFTYQLLKFDFWHSVLANFCTTLNDAFVFFFVESKKMRLLAYFTTMKYLKLTSTSRCMFTSVSNNIKAFFFHEPGTQSKKINYKQCE